MQAGNSAALIESLPHRWASRAAETREQNLVSHDFLDCIRQRNTIALRHKQAVDAIVNRFRNTCCRSADHRYAASKGFHDGNRKPIAVSVFADDAGKHDEVRVMIALHDFLLSQRPG